VRELSTGVAREARLADCGLVPLIDVPEFRQQFIGQLASLASAAAIVGALTYAPLSRRIPLKRLINMAIGNGVVGTLAYLAYHDARSAIVIDIVFGCVNLTAFSRDPAGHLHPPSCRRHLPGRGETSRGESWPVRGSGTLVPASPNRTR